MAEQQQSKQAEKPKRKSAAEEFLDCFEKLANLVRRRSSGYSSQEQALAKEFLAETDGMIARARADFKE